MIVVIVDLCIRNRVRDCGTDHAPIDHFGDDDAVRITDQGTTSFPLVPAAAVVVVVVVVVDDHVVVLVQGTIEVIHDSVGESGRWMERRENGAAGWIKMDSCEERGKNKNGEEKLQKLGGCCRC